MDIKVEQLVNIFGRIFAPLCLIVFMSAWFFAIDVHAEENGITISPAFQEVEIAPNEPQKDFEIEVKNTTDFVNEIRLSVYDFGQMHESGGISFLGDDVTDLDTRYGLASWLSLASDVVVVEPNSTAMITATINNKESLSPGGHYAAIIGRVQAQADNEGDDSSNIDVQMIFSSLVFAKKTGGEKYNMEVDEIETSGLMWKTPDAIKMRWHNSGNVYAVPRGVVTIEDWRGRTVARGTINQGSLLVLPESMRIMPVELMPMSYAYLPGLYRLTIQFRYDGREDFTNIQKSFLYIGPYAAGIILVMVTILIYFWRSRRT